MSDVSMKVMAYLRAKASVDGVATVKMKDGEVFLLTAQYLRALAEKAEQSPDKDLLMFVQTGPLFSDIQS